MSDDNDEKPSFRQRWGDLSAEDFKSRMTKRQDTMRHREKLSSEDVEQMWSQRTQQWKDTLTRNPIDIGKYLRLGVGFLALAGAALIGSSANAITAEAEESQARHDAEIAALEQDIAELEAMEEATDEEFTDLLQEYLTAASEAGNEVAALQNGFAEVLFAANNQEREEDIGPYPAEIDAAQYRQNLDEYWASSSLLVENDDVAYAVSRMEPFTSTEMDPRYAWYSMMHEPGSRYYADPEDYSWELVSVLPRAASDPERINVTWLNRRSDDGWLMAWATATYSADDGVFSDLRIGRTSTGVEYQHWGANHEYDDSFSDQELIEEGLIEGEIIESDEDEADQDDGVYDETAAYEDGGLR